MNKRNAHPGRARGEKPVGFKMVTFNLGYHIILDEAEGSERGLVERCHARYGPTRSGEQLLSKCTRNALDGVAREYFPGGQCFDICGFQEVPTLAEARAIVAYLTLAVRRDSGRISYYYDRHNLLVWNVRTLGAGAVLSPRGMALGTRSMQVVFFAQHNLLVANLHAPHRFKLKVHIEGNLQHLVHTNQINPSRVIVLGDFNDGHGTLESLLVNGVTLAMKNRPPRSCCYDAEYKYLGDYIFANRSILDAAMHFGLPLGYQRHVPLVSDHDPVVLW